jgi:hypothetical protein
MNKNTEPLDLALSANGISAACRQNDTLSSYDIYYINPWRRMNSPRVFLLRKRGFLRSGALEFIFSHAWSG